MTDEWWRWRISSALAINKAAALPPYTLTNTFTVREYLFIGRESFLQQRSLPLRHRLSVTRHHYPSPSYALEMSALQGCDGCDAYKTKSTWERAVRNTGSARNNSAFRRDYMPQTVKIDLNYTLSYTDKRIISYLCKCYLPVGLWCHLRLTESVGGALHIERRYWRFVFGCFETTTLDYRTRTLQG